MFRDLVTELTADLFELLFYFQPVEIAAAAAIGADQQVLVMFRTAEYGLAVAQVMDVFDQVQFFQHLDGAIDGDQANTGGLCAR
jgi:hypothetical protein